jgi:predicted DCC family thiol-disulfide oxidoreductase YuxK
MTPVVLFDGDCAVCNATVGFLLDRDRKGVLRYAPLQGAYGTALRARTPAWPANLDSLVLDEGDRVSWYSTGVLRAMRWLPAPWPAFSLFLLVPWPIRDAAYRAFAAVRYRVFGRVERCRLPRPGEEARFLA